MNQNQVVFPQPGCEGQPRLNIQSDSTQGMLIIKTATKNTAFYQKKLNCQIIRIMSVCQVIMWAVVTISQIIIIAVQAPTNEIGTGLWSGIFFGIAGGLGIVAASKPTRCMIMGLMVMSVFAAIFSGFLLGLAALGVGVTARCKTFWCGSSPGAAVTFYGVMVFAALAEGIISIVTAALCCRACCCLKSLQPIVKFIPAGQETQHASGYIMTIPMNMSGSAPLQASAPTMGFRAGFPPTTDSGAGFPTVQAPVAASSMAHASAGFNVVSFPEVGFSQTSEEKALLL